MCQLQRFFGPSLLTAGQAQLDLAQHLEQVVVIGVGDGQHAAGQIGTQGDFATIDVEDRQPTQGLAHAGVIAEELAELTGPVVGHDQLGVGVAPGGDGGSQGELQFDLPLPAFTGVGQLAGQGDPLAEKGDGFAVTRPLSGQRGGQLIVGDGLTQ